MMTLAVILLVLAGGAWRVVDGMGYGPGGFRVAMGAGVALLAAIVGILPIDLLGWTVVVIVAASAMWAVVKGYDDWTRWENLYQYWPATIGAGVATAYSMDVTAGLIYVGLLVIAGAAHPVVERLFIPNGTRYAEAVVGACVIGGLVVL